MVIKKEEEGMLPFERLDALKKEIESLKQKNPVSKRKASPEAILETMDNLTETLNGFMSAFEDATEELKLEEKEEELFIEQLKPLHDKMDQIIEQNEKIAKGIIAVANMLNSDIPFIKRMVASNLSSKNMDKPLFGSMPPPMSSIPRQAPKMSGAPIPPPPMPNQKDDKKGRFSELFK